MLNHVVDSESDSAIFLIFFFFVGDPNRIRVPALMLIPKQDDLRLTWNLQMITLSTCIPIRKPKTSTHDHNEQI